MRKFLLIILLFSTSYLNAQDTIHAKFIPMHVGNYYVYKNGWLFGSSYSTCSITRDTVVNGHTYYWFQGFPHIGSGFFRYDSTNGNFLEFSPGDGCSSYPDDIIIDSLNSSVNDQISNCGDYTRRCLNRNDSTIHFLHDALTWNEITYKLGLGIYRTCSGEPPPCEYFSTLQGAIINGVLWGDTTVTNFQQLSSNVPDNYQLHQNYPNPFNPATVIKFDIPKSSNAAIIIYDNTGRMVEKLVDGELSPGTYETVWNASGYASGVYFYRLEWGNFTQTRKMLLVR